jgi:hypothetical protein
MGSFESRFKGERGKENRKSTVWEMPWKDFENFCMPKFVELRVARDLVLQLLSSRSGIHHTS